MNILFINKADLVGGAAEVAWNLRTELMTRGHEVSLFVCDKNSSDHDVRVIPRPKWLFCLSHLLGADSGLFDTDYILQTEEFKRADIIHCHNLHGHYFNLRTLLKMSQLKPVVWTLHDMWALTPYCSHSFANVDNHGFYPCQKMSTKSVCKRWNGRFLRNRKEKIYKRLAVTLVTPSVWLRQKVSASILMDKDSRLIHNGIETVFRPDVSRKTELRRKLNLPVDKKIVLFVASGGKDNIWKGWQYAEQAIDSFQDRDDVLFVCIGGQNSDRTRKNLFFVDYLADKQILAEYYAAADVFMLTSTAESFALVIVEAMYAGLPVVSFAVGVAEEIISHKNNGYIARYGDVQDFIRGLNFALNLKITAEEILSNQKLINDKFSIDVMTDKYLALYDELA